MITDSGLKTADLKQKTAFVKRILSLDVFIFFDFFFCKDDNYHTKEEFVLYLLYIHVVCESFVNHQYELFLRKFICYCLF